MTRQIAVTVLCVAVSVAASAADGKKKTTKSLPKPTPKPLHLDQAYFAGRKVKFDSVPVKAGRALVVGPWNLGPKISPKPSDKRPNLYFVSPGTQHRVPEQSAFDHNEVLSAMPDGPSDYDVFWVLVLDPSVKEEFTSEQEIIVATQEEFQPGEDFTFDQIPSAGFLRTFLKKSDLESLKKFRRPEGGLPKVAVVRAGFTVRAVAEEMPELETPQTTTQTADPPK
ncbi:MAG TPA: hypothetical protein VN577_00890 [Terriglobales bacterium]|nr:hypothetical protein [Terriglobales bacterium]